MAPAEAGANTIYLSPHYDDAAFSLGAWLTAHPGGRLVNLFTRSQYTAASRTGDVDEVSAIRAAEDRAFAARVGLDAVALGLEEPSLRGRKSRDAAGVGDDIGQLRDPLMGWLDTHAGQGAVIYCPAAIGGHVNHLATRAVAWEWAVARGRERDLRFYEDLPYASQVHLRRRGLPSLRAATAPWRLERRAWLTGKAKLELVGLYPTQFKGVPSLRRFSPIALWPPLPHEAVWRVVG
jgi:LmbE family N-acetylglucosaminyl deacetylase